MQIVVLGMHRSGTSAVTRLINMMGAYVGPEHLVGGPAFDNQKGFWERSDVRELNERVLESAGAAWDDIHELDPEAIPEETLRDFDAEARRIVFGLDGHRPWVVKDPRFCVLFPLWRPHLEVPVCLHVWRSPLEVAQSLKRRNRFSVSFGVALWEVYCRRALEASRGLPRGLVDYGALMKDPQATVEELFQFLSAAGVQNLRLPGKTEIAAFLDDDLRHEREKTVQRDGLLNRAQLQLLRKFEQGTILEQKSPGRLSGGAYDILEDHRAHRRSLAEQRALLSRKESELAGLAEHRARAEGQLAEMRRQLEKIEQSSLEGARQSLDQACRAFEQERLALAQEHEAFEQERLALAQEHEAFEQRRRDLEALRDVTATERQLLAEERQTCEAERESTAEQRRLLEAERDNLAQQSLKLTEEGWRIEDQRRAYAEEAGKMAAQVAAHEQRIRDLQAELAAIHRSRLWRLGNSYWSLLRAVGLLRRTAASDGSAAGQEGAISAPFSESSQIVPQEVRKIEEARSTLASQRQELERERSALHEEQRALAERQRRLTGERRELELQRGAVAEQPSGTGDRKASGMRFEASRSPRPVPRGEVPAGYDVICFPIIDWHFRYQRPQQLMTQFALHGHRGFYLRTTFHRNGPSAVVEPIRENVFSLHMPGSAELSIIGRTMPEPQLEILLGAFERLRQTHGLREAVCVVDLPFWAPLVFALRRRHGWKVVYDCLDDLSGFSNIEPELLAAEHALIAESDSVMVTSRRLHEKVAPQARRTLLNPNATDYDHFHRSPSANVLSHLPRPIIGYYGAISEWFDVELVRHAAAARQQWQFVLIGDTWGADVSPLEELPNVHLLGEMPYDELPAYLHAFDVATIPFKINELTRATNPVKFYEYLSAAKPIVAVDLPELEPFPDYYYPARSPSEFVAQLEAALAEKAHEKRQARVDFARRQTWEARFEALAGEIRQLFGKVAIVIVSYNNLDYLRLCLESIGTKTTYPNFEVIVVDNGSGPEVESFLREVEARTPWVKVIFNGENLGFPRANNIGIRAAEECDYVVLVNDDVVVTRGWLGKLVHYLDKPGVELVGPTTNWAGNEARIEVDYETLEEMEAFAARYVREHEGEYFYIKVLAMYCVAMRRSLLDEIGLLDERFGIGMFEDDDFSRRVRQAGGEVVCAEDVFIHHWGRSSFKAMDQQVYDRLFEDNRRRFEEKWGEPWEPHSYREASGLAQSSS